MPDHSLSQNFRASASQEFFLSGSGSPDDDPWKEISRSTTSTFDHDHGRKLRFSRQLIQKKSRVKESSKYYGVRFRSDLQKWVAEIRVAEWKSVDKKVWLGTFDTELGSARAVDVARKLLNCKKKRRPNWPCMKLDAYSETIPSYLNLNHLEKDAMFKEVTQFVKKKAQEYATNLGTDDLHECFPAIPITNSFAPLPTHCLNMEVDFSFDSQNSFVPSFGNSNFLPSCGDNNFLVSCEEALPTSSLGNTCISNFEDKEPHWKDCCNGSIVSQPKWHSMGLIQCDDQPMVECEARNTKSHLSWDDFISIFLEDTVDDKLLQENMLVGSQHLNLDDKQVFCVQEHASMDIVSKNEVTYNNCSVFGDILFQKPASSANDTSMEWAFPQHQFVSTTFHEIALDDAQVC